MADKHRPKQLSGIPISYPNRDWYKFLFCIKLFLVALKWSMIHRNHEYEMEKNISECLTFLSPCDHTIIDWLTISEHLVVNFNFYCENDYFCLTASIAPFWGDLFGRVNILVASADPC